MDLFRQKSLTTMRKLPGVLSFARCHVVTDGEMFSLMDDSQEIPVPVIRHGIRGTQNILKTKGLDSQKTAVTGNGDVNNIQITETAKLDTQAKALVVRFSIAMLDLRKSLFACAGGDPNGVDRYMMRSTVEDFTKRAMGSAGMREVACRYSRNIANGRWLWRNRSIASAIEIRVTDSKTKDLIAVFPDAKKIPMNSFDDYSHEEVNLSLAIQKQMEGESHSGLIVEATLKMPVDGGIEVFPSQNYVEKKPDGFARSLYKIGHPEKMERTSDSIPLMAFKDSRLMGSAALRDQKIFNAIRTIDTWYSSFSENGFPIPVEPAGASLEYQSFFRGNGEKNSAFEFFKRLCLIDPNSPEGMFCIASLDRGGVYSESDKSDKPKKIESEDVQEEGGIQ